MKLPRILVALLFLPVVALAQVNTKPSKALFKPKLQPGGTYQVSECDPITAEHCGKYITKEICRENFPCEVLDPTRAQCEALYPVVAADPAPATVSQSLILLPVPTVVESGNDTFADVGVVATGQTAPFAKRNWWNRRTAAQKGWIAFGAGLLVGAVVQHQFDDDDGGDTHKKKVIIYPPPDCPEPCHGHDCD